MAIVQPLTKLLVSTLDLTLFNVFFMFTDTNLCPLDIINKFWYHRLGPVSSKEKYLLLKREDRGLNPAEDKSFFRLAREKEDGAIYRRKMSIPLRKRVALAGAT